MCRTGSMATIARRPHTVVATFRSGFNAYLALRRLDRAGLPPQDVALVAGEPELEAEAQARPHAPRAAIAGAALGVLIGAAYVIFGGSGLLADILGILLGLAVATATGIVGFFVGRTLARRASRWSQYEHVVKDGGAIVTVACAAETCDRAKEVLKSSGAEMVVDERENPMRAHALR
jgi:hypothetical protein